MDGSDKNFKFASSLIKIIAVLIAIMVLVISRYAFIFFTAAMLPTIFVIFFDRNPHKCMSATVCSFNLIGTLPYLIQIWEASSVDYMAKRILANISTWAVIYGAAFIGQLLYSSMPMIVVKIYSARNEVKRQKLQKKVEAIEQEWGMK